jgi:hypothetical protein
VSRSVHLLWTVAGSGWGCQGRWPFVVWQIQNSLGSLQGVSRLFGGGAGARGVRIGTTVGCGRLLMPELRVRRLKEPPPGTGMSPELTPCDSLLNARVSTSSGGGSLSLFLGSARSAAFDSLRCSRRLTSFPMREGAGRAARTGDSCAQITTGPSMPASSAGPARTSFGQGRGRSRTWAVVS